MKYYCEDAAEVLSDVESSEQRPHQRRGRRRLERDGRNELAAEKKDSLIKRFFAQMADPMIIILIVAAAISAVTGIYEEGLKGITDTVIILIVVIVNAVLGVYQESKAEKAIEALQAMSAATSKVLRDGKVCVVPSAELVVGDVVLLEAGDAVPADGRIIESASLQIEEAALTGESVPVYKFIDIIDLKDSSDVPLGDRKNMCYMGSTVTYGRGSAVITATGMDTEMGKIADALSRAEQGQTPLQIKLSQLSKILTWLVLGICVVIFAVQILRAGGFDFEVDTRQLHGRRLPGRRGHTRGPGRRRHGGALHRRHQHVQAQRDNPPPDRRRDPRLRPGHLLGQDRHPHPEQDDRRRPLRRRRKAPRHGHEPLLRRGGGRQRRRRRRAHGGRPRQLRPRPRPGQARASRPPSRAWARPPSTPCAR